MNATMRQQKIAFGAVIGAVLVVLAAALLPLSLGVRFLLVLLAALCSAAGCVLYFPILLEKVTLPREAQELVETLTEDLEDDIEAVKEARLTPTLGYLVVTLLASAVFIWLVLDYRKLGATWGRVPILIPAAVAVFAAIALMAKSIWFQVRSIRTPLRAFLIPLAGIVIATSLGIYMTEPLEYGGSSAYERSVARGEREPYTYDYRNTRGYFYYSDFFANGASRSRGGSGWLDIDLDVDDGAIVLLIIVLIIVAIVLILGSTAIPHFWVLAGLVFLTCMGMIALRELRVRPEGGQPARGRPARDQPEQGRPARG